MFMLIEDVEVEEVVEMIFNVISQIRELSTKTKKMSMLKNKHFKNLNNSKVKEVETNEELVVVVVKKEEIKDRRVIKSKDSLMINLENLKMKERITRQTRQFLKKNNSILKLNNEQPTNKKRNLIRKKSFLKSGKMREINWIVRLMWLLTK